MAIVTMQGARNEIFAMQPAPIQVSYMGFPGTTGASYIDYLVTDEVFGDSVFKYWISFPCLTCFLLTASLFHLYTMHIFIQKSWCIFHIATLLTIINRSNFLYDGRKKTINIIICSFDIFYCLFSPGCVNLQVSVNFVCRKIWMCWIQIASTNDQIMVSLKTSSYLHASTSCTKWILKSLILGNMRMALRLIYLHVQ